MVTWSWERRNTENTNTVTPGTESELYKHLRLALHYVLGWFPHCLQGDPGDNKSSTLAKRGPGCLLPPRLPLLCSQEGAKVLLAALVGIAGPWQYPKGFSDTVVKRRWGFSTWSETPLAMPSSLWAFYEQRWIKLASSINTQESSMRIFRWAGANNSKWIEGLNPVP